MITRDKYLGIPGPNGLVLSRCNYLAVSFLSPTSTPRPSTLSYVKQCCLMNFHSRRTGKVGGGASGKANSPRGGKRAEAS